MTNFSIGQQEQAKRAYSLAELCAHEHSEFIRCAYLTVLGRLPDADGMEFYRRRLVDGVSKLTILNQLRRSAEARRHDPGIAGFDRALRRHRQGNIPFIGRFIRLFTQVEADDERARRERARTRQLDRMEARLLAIHIDCIDRIESLRLRGNHVSADGRQPAFGLMPAGNRSALPWEANGHGKAI